MILFLGSPVNEEYSNKILKERGYSNIFLKLSWSCGHFDHLRIDFEARDKNGKSVSGKICRNILFGDTIKLD